MTDITYRRPRELVLAPPESEHRKARWWRERMGLSRAKLASLTGYSVSAIARYERGEGSAAEWQKYRMACGSVDAGWTTWAWEDTSQIEVEVEPATIEDQTGIRGDEHDRRK